MAQSVAVIDTKSGKDFPCRSDALSTSNVPFSGREQVEGDAASDSKFMWISSRGVTLNSLTFLRCHGGPDLNDKILGWERRQTRKE